MFQDHGKRETRRRTDLVRDGGRSDRAMAKRGGLAAPSVLLRCGYGVVVTGWAGFRGRFRVGRGLRPNWMSCSLVKPNVPLR